MFSRVVFDAENENVCENSFKINLESLRTL